VLRPSRLAHGAVHQEGGPVQVVHGGEVVHRHHAVEDEREGQTAQQRAVHASHVESRFQDAEGARVGPVTVHGNLLGFGPHIIVFLVVFVNG